MSNSINLVSTNVAGLEKELKRLKVFRVIAVISLIIVLSVSVLAFILNITIPIDSVKKEQQAAIAGISLFHKKLTQYVLLNDRVKNISSLIGKRANYVSQINQIYGITPADASISALGIEKNKISVTVSSMSLLSINKIIDSVVSLGVNGKTIKNVVIQGLTLDVGSGKYSLSLQADIL
jgi:hypothetical protein